MASQSRSDHLGTLAKIFGATRNSPKVAVDLATRLWRLTWFALAGLAAVLLLVRFYINPFAPDHYIYLAQSFVQGHLNIDNAPATLHDIVAWQGHNYLPFGPLPAILLIPFLPLINMGVELGWFSLALTALNIWLVYRILGHLNIVGEKRRWLALLFVAGTNYFVATLIPFSTYFAHVVVTSFLLLAINETLGGKRPWLIGLFVGLAAMTRLTSGFTLPFFVWMLWRQQTAEQGEATLKSNLSRMAQLGLGLAGPAVLLLLYNYERFGSPLENGYGLATLGTPVLEQAMAQGLFSLVHVPKNLFVLLLQGPLPFPSIDAPVLQFPYLKPSPWGMGIFFTTPAFLLAFRAAKNNRMVQACWLAIGCALVPLITYYGIGWIQFGFRYALDFMPFLFLLAALGSGVVKENKTRAFITVSALVNIWGALWFITLK